jgi:hypothetical protein
VSQPQRSCVLSLQEPRDDSGKLENGEILARVPEQLQRTSWKQGWQASARLHLALAPPAPKLGLGIRSLCDMSGFLSHQVPVDSSTPCVTNTMVKVVMAAPALFWAPVWGCCGVGPHVSMVGPNFLNLQDLGKVM